MKRKISNRSPNLLFSDKYGRLFEHPHLKLLGLAQGGFQMVASSAIIPLPAYSRLFFMPGTLPVGLDPLTGRHEVVDTVHVKGVGRIRPWAVSAFLSPGYMRLYLPAAVPEAGRPQLPLWAYSAVGISRGAYQVPAIRVEENQRWDPANYDDREVLARIEGFKRRFSENRLAEHLIDCALKNHCFAAKNLLLERWEAPLPTSRVCNASCLGCLSHQADERLRSHERISFRPSVKEIVSISISHLQRAPEPIVSFGQGCEGEPLSEYLLIGESIVRIREATKRGTINLNTNASYPERIGLLCKAGLDSIRISLNSARAEYYQAYYRPKGFGLEEVMESIKVAKGHGLFVMVNYLVFPGVTDQEEELEALSGLIEKTGLDFIHLKNLCIDPWFYMSAMPRAKSRPMGMIRFYFLLRERFPNLGLGYFNQIPEKV